jgi:hypothetical protein
MDIAGIREAILRQPFEPFVMRLADGRSMPVPHREFIAVTPRRVLIGFENDSWAIVEPLLIVSLESMPRKGKGGNGEQRRRPKS